MCLIFGMWLTPGDPEGMCKDDLAQARRAANRAGSIDPKEEGPLPKEQPFHCRTAFRLLTGKTSGQAAWTSAVTRFQAPIRDDRGA